MTENLSPKGRAEHVCDLRGYVRRGEVTGGWKEVTGWELDGK